MNPCDSQPLNCERVLIASSGKIRTAEDIAAFQSKVCDCLSIANPLCSVFESCAYIAFRMDVLRSLLLLLHSPERHEPKHISAHLTGGFLVTWDGTGLSFFRVYPSPPLSAPLPTAHKRSFASLSDNDSA